MGGAGVPRLLGEVERKEGGVLCFTFYFLFDSESDVDGRFELWYNINQRTAN